MVKSMCRDRESNEIVVESGLAMQIAAGDSGKAAFDDMCKKLLANKCVLAHILKACVAEYSDTSIEDIEKMYIEGVPHVASAAVHRDEMEGNAINTADGESIMVIQGEQHQPLFSERRTPDGECGREAGKL